MSDLVRRLVKVVLSTGGTVNPVWKADTTNITADQTAPTADGAQ